MCINITAVRGREDIRLRETQETEVRIPQPLQENIMYYKRFSFNYDKEVLFNIFKSSELTRKQVYLHANNLPLDQLPCMNVFNRQLNDLEYSMAKIVGDTGFHVSPRNNGLILFPVNGVVRFTFLEDTVDANTPIIINGKQQHTYGPTCDDTIFFAIKIPSYMMWADAINLL